MSSRSICKSAIALFSEMVWLYFGLAFWAKIEWEITQLPHPESWIIACLLGYGGQYLLRRWSATPALLYTISGVFLLILVIYSGKGASSYGSGYVFAVSMSVAFLYLRSSYFACKEPTRAQMLLRFEGNIIWYILYVLILPAHPGLDSFIHLPFMFGIVASLAGMILTLHPGNEEEKPVQTKIVGNKTTGFAAVIVAILVLGVLMSLVMLWPPIRKGFMLVLKNAGEGTLTLWGFIMDAFAWLFSLLPAVEEQTLPPPQSPPTPVNIEEGEVWGSLSISPYWGIGIVVVVGIIVALWLLSKMVIKWKPVKSKTRVVRYEQQQSFLQWLWQQLRHGIAKWLGWWKRKFPHFYACRIYWYFHLLQGWGERNGLSRYPHETPREYGQRLAEQLELPEDYDYRGDPVNLRDAVTRLVECYAFTYYTRGRRKKEENDFCPLLSFMKKNRLVSLKTKKNPSQ